MVARFIHDHRELVDGGRGYVWVPELHPGGHGWHFHILRHGGMSRELLGAFRRSWTCFCVSQGLSLGGRSEYVRFHIKHLGARSAASYAAKYLGKAMAEGHLPPGAHRYDVSEGLDLPKPVEEWFRTRLQAIGSLPCPDTWACHWDGVPEGLPFFWVAVEAAPS